ncbi:MAG: hypothetical protein ACKPKO_32525 [Candidatus Fonsibacter sp.]
MTAKTTHTRLRPTSQQHHNKQYSVLMSIFNNTRQQQRPHDVQALFNNCNYHVQLLHISAFNKIQHVLNLSRIWLALLRTTKKSV